MFDIEEIYMTGITRGWETFHVVFLFAHLSCVLAKAPGEGALLVGGANLD